MRDVGVGRHEFAIFDKKLGRLVDVGDVCNIDMGSYSSFDGPVTFDEVPGDDDLLELLEVERDRYVVVKIEIKAVEEVGDLIAMLEGVEE